MFHAAIKFSGTLGYPAHRHPKERRSAESTIAIGDFGMSRAREWRFIFEAIAQIRGVMAIRHAALLELAPDDETGYRVRTPVRDLASLSGRLFRATGSEHGPLMKRNHSVQGHRRTGEIKCLKIERPFA